jgi:oligopeptide/dipeptide ABC transporter ATP-binding protein
MLQIQQLTVSYKTRRGNPQRALDNVSLSIDPGEIIGVLGESGCGKSTLANAIAGLLPKTAVIERGTVHFRSADLLTMREEKLCAIRGRKIAVVPQDPALSLNPVLTAGAQIGEVLSAHVQSGKKERREKVFHLLEQLGFDSPEHIARAYPHQLSGGQRQRVCLAQAIACEPELLIADEPTSKLDPSLRWEIAELFLRLHKALGVAILLISHDVGLVASLAQRIVLMYSGQVIESAPRTAMLTRPLHPYGQELLEQARSLVSTTGAEFRFPIASSSPEQTTSTGCSFEPRCRERMLICGEKVPSSVRPDHERTVSCFKYGE